MQKVAAVTGASAGIGRAVAFRLARDGFAVAICARRRDRLEQVADAVRQSGGRIVAISADVSREADMRTFVGTAIEQFGRLDAMVCNAGFGVYGTIEQIASEQMEKLLAVNYLGTYHAARAALPVFRQQNQGHLIIVSSIVGKRGIPYMGAYAATKFAQVGLAECLRAELVDTPIHVSIVYPISTETEFFEVMTRESGFATRARGPRQHADAVADAVARAIDRPRPEVYPYRNARGLVLLNSLAPALCDRLVKRWGRTPI